MGGASQSLWTRLGCIIGDALAFDYRKANLISFGLICSISCATFYVSSTSFGREVLPFLNSTEGESLVASSDKRDIENVDWAKDAPKVTFIDFDIATVQALKDARQEEAANGTISLKHEIADVLDWIRAGPRPTAVFLDLAPLYSKNAKGDAALAQAILRWRADTQAAPMAIFAGPSCYEVGDKGVPSIMETGPFEPAMALRADGSVNADSKIIWACPMYDELELSYWSCAFALNGEEYETIALPSPGWFAFAVREQGDRFASWMANDLQSAREACANGTMPDYANFPGAGGALVPKYTRTRFTFDPLDPTRHKQDGNTILDLLPADGILSGLEVSRNVMRDRFVVIGSSDTSQGFSDMLTTSVGRVPGSLIVATDMRHGWLTGFPKTRGWLQDAAIVFVTCTIAYLAMIFARRRRMSLTGETRIHIFDLLLTNAGLVGLLCTSACVFLSVALSSSISGNDIVRVALSVIAIELIFTFGSISEDAHEQVC
jgi:hypothetical protein